MRVALVHDYLTQDGGAERVLRALQEIFPKAPTYVLVHNKEKMERMFPGNVHTSFIQKLPFGVSRYQWYLPLMPLAVERLNVMDFDVVLSSSSAFAKGVVTSPETLHLCYCHTPTRYLWTDTHSYIKELAVHPVIKSVLPFVLTRIRMWDRIAADRVDQFIANSKNVSQRIKKYYGRDSHIIHPPVETEMFTTLPKDKIGNYFLAGGRLVAYKRFDLIVQAFNRIGIPLKIFGEGPEEENLRKLAKDNIEFLGRVTDEERAKLYREAIAFIHPQVEDFGLTAVESMASGRPVIAYGKGGALETIRDGETGKLFDEQTWECLSNTIIKFDPNAFDPERIRDHALSFSKGAFKEKIRSYIDEQWKNFNDNRN